MGMSCKRSLLLVQVLLFLLATLLGIATSTLIRNTGALRGPRFPSTKVIAVGWVIVVLIIGLMIWQHVIEERLALLARPVWDSDRSPFLG